MTAGQIARSLAIAMVVAAASGCGTSKPARFYTLDATATTGGAPATHTAVMVGR